MLRKSRPAQIAAGALILAIPGSAVALSSGQAAAQGTISVHVSARHVTYGGEVIVTGTASSAGAGQLLSLDFSAAGSRAWHVLSSSKVRRDGSFKLTAPLHRSGLVRVSRAGGASGPRANGSTGGASPGATTQSSSTRVSVAASFRVARASIDVLGGQSAHVRGKLMPALAGRRVELLGRRSGRWRPLASAHTGAKGGFDVRYTAGSTGHESLAVRFAGDRLNTRSWAHAGQLTAFRQSGASWYNDAGSTACGFHAYFGVANRDLPCGTKVTFAYGGHTVNAVVDDRGPYVGGRDWDLNQNTAAALGFNGVDTVWSSI